jgi:hypothetical protein
MVEFIAVHYDLLQPLLQRFLAQSAKRIQNTDFNPSVERQVLWEVGDLDMKYSNGLTLYALGRDEHLAGMVFQPAIRDPVWHSLRRPLAFPVILAFTNYHFIIIGEEQAKNHSEYGWVITYCPLSVIRNIESVPEKRYQRLIVQLQCDQVEVIHEVKVDQATAQNVLELWQKTHLPKR